jgi:hypothetical protein
MFTIPDDLDLFNLSTVFEVCDDGRGNLAISKLLHGGRDDLILSAKFIRIVPENSSF